MRDLVPALLLLLAGCAEAAPHDVRTTSPPVTPPVAVEGSPDAVPGSDFTGPAAGCHNLLVYRPSEDGTQYVVVTVDEKTLGMEVGATRTVDLGDNSSVVEVSVDVYAAAPASEAYCNGVHENALPARTRWSAEAGLLTIELTADAAARDGSYRATVRLEGGHFSKPEGGLAVVIPSIVIEDVRVGPAAI